MLQCLPFISLKAKLIPIPGPLHMSFLPRRFFPEWILLARHQPSKHFNAGTSLEAQWLGLRVSTSGDTVSVPGWGTKIMHVVHCSQKEKNKTKPTSKQKAHQCKHHIFRRLVKSSSAPTLPTSSLLLFSFIAFLKASSVCPALYNILYTQI